MNFFCDDGIYIKNDEANSNTKLRILEKSVIDEINLARSNPQEYAKILDTLMHYFFCLWL
jgi:hypothetical protein